jgi:hypothetical protein
MSTVSSSRLPPLVSVRAAPFVPMNFKPMTVVFLVCMDVGAYTDVCGVYSTYERALEQVATLQALYRGEVTCNVRISPLDAMGDIDVGTMTKMK